MTDHGDRADEAIPPPATTRWSDDPAETGDTLAPPFVAGRPAEEPAPSPEEASTHEAASHAEVAGEPEQDAPVAVDEPPPATDEPAVTEAVHAEDAFPFESDDAAAMEEEPARIGDDGSEPEPEDSAGATGEPWSPEAVYDDLAGPTDDGPPTGADQDAAVAEEPEMEPGGSAPEVPPGGEVPALGMDAPTDTARADDAALDVAELLERLARLLRDEGTEAVRAEMASSDRLTGLLAGLVAGYLSSRAESLD